MPTKTPKEEAASQVAPQAKQEVKKRDVVSRWGGDSRILAEGFVAVPTLFLQRMSQFKPYSLTPAEAVFVICVMAHKWDDRDPYPSYKRIATWMGKSESYVRRLAKNLATKGLLKRQARVGQTNSFDFKALFTLIVQDPQSVLAKKRAPAAKKVKVARSAAKKRPAR